MKLSTHGEVLYEDEDAMITKPFLSKRTYVVLWRKGYAATFKCFSAAVRYLAN
jgi:hypothetical protein